MSVPTGIGTETQANTLFTALVGADNATLPDVDLFDDEHTVPWTENSEILADLKKIEVSELITDFKEIMEGLAAQLKTEHDAGRITGGKYAETYLTLMQGALQGAVQFTLGKQTAFLSAAKMQADAIASHNQNEVVRLQAMMSRAQFALTKLKLASEDSAFGQSEYQRETLLPAQKSLVDEQKEAQRAQTLSTRSDGVTAVAGLLGKQMALYEQQKQSYIDDTQIKGSKIFSDLWITMKTLDIDTATPDYIDPSDTAPGKGDANFTSVFTNLKSIAEGT
jgi:hypothetical protein